MILCWISFPPQKGCKIKMFKSTLGEVCNYIVSRCPHLSWKRERRCRVSLYLNIFQPKSRVQSWKKEPVNSANDRATMMSQCLITTQPEDLGSLQLLNDIIGNWFRKWRQAVFYETRNCWTKPPEQGHKRLWRSMKVHYWWPINSH